MRLHMPATLFLEVSDTTKKAVVYTLKTTDCNNTYLFSVWECELSIYAIQNTFYIMLLTFNPLGTTEKVVKEKSVTYFVEECSQQSPMSI